MTSIERVNLLHKFNHGLMEVVSSYHLTAGPSVSPTYVCFRYKRFSVTVVVSMSQVNVSWLYFTFIDVT